MNSIIIGTAGHVDHGKTTLIKNLTGIDTDRLKEEKARGLTIDIGFAFLGENISLIDVPGHEKFVKNMVAGAATINFAMLVIAADDGIMPQTIEHFEILKFLNVQQGIIVLTKIDLVDMEQLKIRKQEIQDFFAGSFLENEPIFEVSNINDDKIDNLKLHLLALQENDKTIKNLQPFRLPIDRVFSAKGFGTIITGTVISGEFSNKANTLMIYPEKIPIKVRSMESQNQTVNRIGKNQRIAINLQSIDKKLLYRGQILSEKGLFKSTNTITCSINKTSHKSIIKYNELVKLHINTLEVKTRIKIIGHNSLPEKKSVIVQFDFDKPICVGFHDRFIIRKLSPAITVAGGMVLDVNAPKLKKTSLNYIEKYLKITSLNLKDNTQNIFEIYQFLSIKNLSLKLSQYPSETQTILKELISENKLKVIGKHYLSVRQFDLLKDKFLLCFNTDNLFNGIEKSELMNLSRVNKKIFNDLLNELISQKELIINEGIVFQKVETENIQNSKYISKIEKHILKQGYKLQNFIQIYESLGIDKKTFQDAINYLKHNNNISTLDKGYLIHQIQITQAENLIITFLQKHEQATVSELKQLLNTTRRYILPILNYFDENGFLIREGDFRKLK